MDPEVGDGIEEEHVPASDDSGAVVDHARGDEEANVGDKDPEALAGAEDGAHGVEVALGPPAGGFALEAVGAAGDVEEEVGLPAEELVGEEADEGDDGGVLEEVVLDADAEDAALLVLGLGAGHESHVLLHVAGEAVVAGVGVLPREVGHEEEGVGGPADDVVDAGVQGEGAVAALVGEDPETRAHEALDEAVGDPGGAADARVLDAGDVGDGGVGQRRDEEGVPHEIRARDPERGLEAVGGDGVADGVDVGVFPRGSLNDRLLLMTGRG